MLEVRVLLHTGPKQAHGDLWGSDCLRRETIAKAKDRADAQEYDRMAQSRIAHALERGLRVQIPRASAKAAEGNRITVGHYGDMV